MQAGEVHIKLMADISNLMQQMQAAERLVKMTSTGIESAFAGIKATALGVGASIAAGLGINAFKNILEGSIKAAAGLNDLAIVGSTTVEALSGLASIGKYTDTGADAIVQSMNKLTKNLTSATEESAGTGKAIQALGLDMAQFRNLKPEEQMLAVAKAMGGFQDGAGKSAVAMALYGKEGAKLLPFFKDLAAAHDLEAKFTTEQAAAADNLDDNLKRIQTSGEAWKKTLVMGMVPALDQAAQAFLDVTSGTGGLRDEVKKLSDDGSIAAFTRGAITGLTYVADMVAVVWRSFKYLGGAIGAYIVAGQQAITGNLTGAAATISSFGQDMQDMWSEQTLGQRLRGRLQEIQAVGQAAEAVKPKLNVTDMGRTDKTTGRATIDEYAKLIEQIREKTAASSAELTQENALTDGQKLALKIMEQLRNGKLKLSIAERESISVALESMLATEQLSDAHKAQIKATKEANDAHVKYLQSLDAANAKLLEDIETQRLHNAEIGLSKEAVAALVAARDDERATLIELQAIKQLDRNGDEVTYNLLMRQAQAIRELSRLKQQGAAAEAAVEEAKKASDAWTRFYDSIYNGLTDSLYRAFEQGKGFFEALWTGIRNLFKTTVLRLSIQAVVGSVLGAIGMPGIANAQGAGGSGIGSIFSAGKSIYNAVTSGGSMFSNFGGSMGGMVSDFGTSLVDHGFVTFGTQLENLGLSMAANSSLINTFGNGMGYLNAVLAASKGQWGTALGSALGTYFGGPLGAVIGSTIGSWVDKTFGGGTKPSIEGGYASPGTTGSANGKTYVNGFYGGALDSSAKKISDSISTEYTNFVTSLGRTAGNLTSQVFMGYDGNGGKKGSQNALGMDAQINGKWIYNRWTDNGGSLNAGTSDQDMTDAVSLSSKKILIEALKATDLGPALNTYLSTVVTAGQSLEELDAVLADVSGFANFQRAIRDLPFDYLKNASVPAIKALTDVAGGMENIGSVLSSYIDLFYSDTEKTAMKTASLNSAFADIGVTMPAIGANTREWYKNLISTLGAQDLSIEANAKAYYGALKLAGAVNDLAPATTDAATSTTDLAQAYREALTTQQQYLSGLVSAGATVRKLLDSMQVTINAATSPQSRLAAARAQYLADLSAAKSGDLSAYNRITSSAQTYMGAGSDMYASGAMQQAIISQIQAELTALPAVADYDRNYTALQAIEAAIKAGNATLVNVEDNTYGLDRLTRIADYVKSLDWGSEASSAAATQTLAAQARLSGWTDADIGKAMGFTAADMQRHFAKYGITDIPLGSMSGSTTATGTSSSTGTGSSATIGPSGSGSSTGGASFGGTPTNSTTPNMHDYIRSLDWGSEASSAVATAQLYAASMAYHWTQAQIGADLGFTTADMQRHFAKYGYPAFADGGAFTNGIVTRPTAFNMAQMGEAGAEAIMPLANVGGRLGVHVAGGGTDKELQASVVRLEALAARQADLIEKLLAHQAAANNVAIGKQERIAQATETTANAAKLEGART